MADRRTEQQRQSAMRAALEKINRKNNSGAALAKRRAKAAKLKRNMEGDD